MAENTRTVLATALLFLFISCSQDNYFVDYDGVDFLAEHPFTSWTTTAGTDYMNFVQVMEAEAGDLSGLPNGGADAHRLELVNLMPNGDFEDGNYSGWTFTGTASLVIETSSLLSGNNSLGYDIEAGSTVERGLGLVTNGQYRLFFTFNPDSHYVFTIGEITIEEPDSPEARINEAFTFIYAGDPFVAGSSQKGILDDMRIARMDINQELFLELPYRADVDSLPIIDGSYVFSVWVKAEIPEQVTPLVHNRFPARGITLSIEGLTGNITHTEMAESWETGPAEWTRYSVTGSIQPTIPEEEDWSDPAIRLTITPRYKYGDETTGHDIGSLLIANPALFFVY